MMAASFKPVGWVAAIGGAALVCYMMSLNVASERAELLKLERGIVDTKQDIRRLETELGTRGRLSQLEHWNAEVLALSAPTAAQFIDDEVTLARFDTNVVPDRGATVRLASAETAAPPVDATPAAPHAAPQVRLASGESGSAPYPLLRQASMVVGAPPAHAKPVALIDSTLLAKMTAPGEAEPKPAVVKKAPPAKPEAEAELTKKTKVAAAVPAKQAKVEPTKKTKLAAADPARPEKARAR